MNPTAAKLMQLTTDNPLDKIIYMKTGSFTAAAMSLTTHTVAHELPFIPLLDGSWSTDASFELISYDPGSGPVSSAPGFIFNTEVSFDADATNIRLGAFNVTGSAVTVHYRAFGFAPSNASGVTPFTASTADRFILNTDYNYTKLFAAGRVTSNTTIIHNIGAKPQVSLWREVGTIITKQNNSSIISSDPRASVGVDSVSFILSSGAIHYRMYLDE
jgi:hypothetical protein